MKLDDLYAIGAICIAILLVLVFTVVGLAFAHWFSEAVYRMGFHGSPAEWISYAIGFLVTVGVTITVLGRLVDGKWWWREC